MSGSEQRVRKSERLDGNASHWPSIKKKDIIDVSSGSGNDDTPFVKRDHFYFFFTLSLKSVLPAVDERVDVANSPAPAL